MSYKTYTESFQVTPTYISPNDITETSTDHSVPTTTFTVQETSRESSFPVYMDDEPVLTEQEKRVNRKKSMRLERNIFNKGKIRR